MKELEIPSNTLKLCYCQFWYEPYAMRIYESRGWICNFIYTYYTKDSTVFLEILDDTIQNVNHASVVSNRVRKSRRADVAKLLRIYLDTYRAIARLAVARPPRDVIYDLDRQFLILSR